MMFQREYIYASDPPRTPEKYPYAYDPYFIRGTTADTKGASSFYSDRLKLWHSPEAIEAARKGSGLEGHGDYWWRSARLAQGSRFLTTLNGKPTKCVAIAEGCNVSNGYPFWVIWTKDANPAPEGEEG